MKIVKTGVTIVESDLALAARVHSKIPEFTELTAEDLKKAFAERCNNRESLIIVAYIGDQPAGYIIGYNRYDDDSFYCWMAGVDSAFRRKGVLGALMRYHDSWAIEHDYNKVRITTRNNRREMLAYLVKNNYLFNEVVAQNNILDNRIHLERSL